MDKNIEILKKTIEEEILVIGELKKTFSSLINAQDSEKNFINSQKLKLEKKLLETHQKLKNSFNTSLFSTPLENKEKTKNEKKDSEELEDREILKTRGGKIFSLKEIAPIHLEKETLDRLKKTEEKKKKVENDKSEYSKFASQMFSKYSRRLLSQKSFQNLEEQLIRANLNFTPVGYISTIILTTIISLFVAGFFFLFFLFFNFEATLPIITRATESIDIRFTKVIWILVGLPLVTFLFMYFYPSLEKRSAGEAIDAELPFATINMAAISGSMINPIKIFEIIASTGEYPALQKEFNKMINEINLYGYDLVSALKNTAKNSPSKSLAELLNGLSTTIHSGGDLVKFFDKRAQTLLFNYKIEQQKAAKSAETMMDLYISLVIAAPMILMLLMMIMKISGLGISASVGLISFLVIMGVVIINAIFMAILHMKRRGA